MLVYMQSLLQGKQFMKNFKEGFEDKSNPFEDTIKKMDSLSQPIPDVNGKSITDVMDEFKDNYQDLSNKNNANKEKEIKTKKIEL